MFGSVQGKTPLANETNMSASKLTAEQIEARDKRRAAFRELWKIVAKMPIQERLATAHKFGITTCEGRELSLCNQILVAMQRRDATFVGGFRQWLKVGRAVRKGEHGAMIWVPTARGTGQMVHDEETGQDFEAMQTRFIIGTVFDIGQTDEVETFTGQRWVMPEPKVAVVAMPLALPEPSEVIDIESQLQTA